MPRTQPLLSLLRPLAAPRAATCRQAFRFSTATRLRIEPTSSTSSSTTAPPPPATKPVKTSNTSPEAPSTSQEASRAADLAAVEAATDADSAQAPTPKLTLPSKRPQSSNTPSKPSTQNKSSKQTRALKAVRIDLPPPKYHIARSANGNLPIYTDYKRGGNLHLTTVRKITGDLSALRDELRVLLDKKNEDVKINSLTGHVIVKGHHVREITEILKARGM